MSSNGQGNPPSRKLAMPLFMVVMGLGMATVATVVTWCNWQSVIDARNALKWVRVPSQIESLTLEQQPDGKGRPIFRFRCKYAYDYRERSYSSSRLGVDDEANRLGSSNDPFLANLTEAYQTHQTIYCFVNPERPEEAVLHREVDFKRLMLFSCFNGVMLPGALLMVGIALQMRMARFGASSQQLANSPTQTIRPKGRALHWAGFTTAILWFFATGPVLLISTYQLNAILSVGCTLLVLGVGLLLIIWSFRRLLRFRRFGQSYIQIEGTSLRLGGTLRGKAVIRGDLTGLREVKITLACMVVVPTPAKKPLDSSPVWSEELLLTCAPVFGQSEKTLFFLFQIPSAASASAPASGEHVHWELLTTGVAQGANLDLMFGLQVLPESSDQPVLAVPTV